MVRIKNDGIVTGNNVRDPINDADDDNTGGDGVRLVLAGRAPSPGFKTCSVLFGLSPVEASVEPTNPLKLLLLPPPPPLPKPPPPLLPAEEWLRRRKNNDETIPPPVSLLLAVPLVPLLLWAGPTRPSEAPGELLPPVPSVAVSPFFVVAVVVVAAVDSNIKLGAKDTSLLLPLLCRW